MRSSLLRFPPQWTAPPRRPGFRPALGAARLLGGCCAFLVVLSTVPLSLPSPAARADATLEWRPDAERMRHAEGDTLRAPFPFEALGALGHGALEALELRARPDDGGWGPWIAVEPRDDAPARSGERATGLMTVGPSREVQVRVAPGADAAAIQSVRVVLQRPTPGPSPEVSYAIAQSDAPRIISRAEWGADPSLLRWSPEYVPVRAFSVHHTASSDGGANPAASIRAIYRYHADTLGWGDIGYNYLIDKSGAIYEGRAGGSNVVGAHSGLHGRGVDGIALLGTFDDERPPEAMLTALARLIAWRARSQNVDPRGSSFLVDRVVPNVFAHRDVTNTNCPGEQVYLALPAIRQQAAALLGVPGTRASISVLGARITPRSISTGDTVQVEVTVRNGGTAPIRTQGPEPGTVYAESDSYASLASPEIPGRVRIGAELNGGTQPDHRFRWGLGGDLAPGEVRTITGSIRFEQPGTHRLWVGVVEEGGGWLQDHIGQTAITVRTPGAASYAAATAATELYVPLVMRDHPAPAGWTTRIVVQNTQDSVTSGGISLHDPEGRVVATAPVSLGARAAAQLDVGGLSGLTTPFVGSAVVRASAPIAAVALHERPGFDRMAVEAVTGGAARLYAPLAARNHRGLSTGLQVQNLGTAATTVSATYVADTGATWTQSAPVAPLGSATLYTPTTAGLPDGFVGSAIIDSSNGQPVAAVVNEARPDGVAMSYLALPTGAAVASAPLLYRNRNDWASGLQIQNLAGTPSTAVASFVPTNQSGGPWEQRGVVAHAIAATFYLPALPQLPDNLVAAALVRSPEGHPLLTLAQHVNARKRIGTAVSAVGAAGSTLYAPLVTNDADGWRTGVQVLNSGAPVASVTLRFFDPRGERVLEVEESVPAGAARTFYLPALLGLPTGFAGSLVIQASSGAVVSAVVNDVR